MKAPDLAIERLEGATPENAALLSALHSACFANGWSAESFSSLMGMPNTFALVGSDSVKPAGFIVCRSAADEGEIIVLGVAPELRRRGIAATLLGAAIDELVAGVVETLYLEVADDNVAACEFYLRSGFEVSGRRKAYYDAGDGNRRDAIVMSRRIGPNTA